MKRVWILLLWASLAAAQSICIVELSGEPAKGAQVRAAQASVQAAVERAGAQVLDYVDTVANALIVRASDPDRLAALPGVRRVHPNREYKLHLDHALPLHGVPDAWQQIGGLEKAGAGVKIGILDTGIDHNHAGFQDPSLAAPAGFPKTGKEEDRAFTSSKVIVARNYSDEPTPEDRFGHGTAVAMVAAGVTNKGPLAEITGVAPKAFLGNYKITGADGRTSSRIILKALDDAVKDGMDVINLSSGGVLAPRPSDDIEVEAVERATQAGVVVVTSAGNEGPDPNTMSSPATAPSAIAVGASSNDRVFGTWVALEGLPPYRALPSWDLPPTDNITAPLADVAQLEKSGMACERLPEGSLQGRIAIILRGVCNFEDKLNNAHRAGAVAALVYNDEERRILDFTMVAGSATLPGMSLSYESGMDLKSRAAANPELQATLVFKATTPTQTDPNRLASFSSRGPNPDDAIKPDLVATGTWLHMATQKGNPDADMYSASGYVLADGTSFAAPLVAGAAAVLKAARGGLTSRQYRSLLINAARPLVPAGASDPMPVQRAGAGSLNLPAALQSTVTAFPTSLSFGVGGGAPDITREITLGNLGAADTLALAVVPIGTGPAPTLSATSRPLAAGGSAPVTLRFSAANLAPGEYQGFVQVQSSAAAVTVRIPYWYAVSSTTPRYLTVLYAEEKGAPGQLLRNAFYFRVTDPSGIALRDANPTVKVLAGGGSVDTVRSIDSAIPGVYSVNLTLGAEPGDNKFQLQAGDLKPVEVVITGKP